MKSALQTYIEKIEADYQRLVALKETIRLMAEMDGVIQGWPIT